MTIGSLDTVIYTAYFLIPGYIIGEIINGIIPTKRKSDAEKVLQSIGYSIFELALWFWLFNLIKNHIQEEFFWLLLIVAVIVTSSVTGFAIGLLKKWNPIRALLNKMKIPTEHVIPTAWDYKFSGLKNGRKLTISLDDGTFIRGSFYNNSMASSDGGYRDIYLEESFVLDDDDKWVKVQNTDGIWIAPNKIKWISFMEDKDNVRTEQQPEHKSGN